MKQHIYAIILFAIMAVLLIGCGEKEAETGETPGTDDTAVLDTSGTIITVAVIDKFIKDFPTIQNMMMERKDELLKRESENPIESGEGARAYEKLSADLKTKGIDFESFMVIYQKINLAVMYINVKNQLDQMTPEARQQKINQLQAMLDDPETGEEDKVEIQTAIEQLKSPELQDVQIPPGISKGEIEVISSKWPEIKAALMPAQGAPPQAVTTPQ